MRQRSSCGTAFRLLDAGADEIQLDLFGDYKSNVALYPTFQNYFRTREPRLLAAWGKNDPISGGGMTCM
jgi:hypothetical protein